MLYVQTMVCRKKRTTWYVPLVQRLMKNINKQSVLLHCVSRWNVYILQKMIHGPSNVKIDIINSPDKVSQLKKVDWPVTLLSATPRYHTHNCSKYLFFLWKSCSFKAKQLNLITHYSCQHSLTQSTTADLLFKRASHFNRTHQSITWLKKNILCLQWLLASSLSPGACGNKNKTKYSPRHITMWQVLNVI